MTGFRLGFAFTVLAAASLAAGLLASGPIVPRARHRLHAGRSAGVTGVVDPLVPILDCQ
jgi:hypothetical protein